MSWISSAIGAAKRFFTGKKPERKPIPAAIAKQPKKSLIITTPKIVTKKQVIVKAPEKKDLIKYTYAEVKDLNKLSMDEYISTVKPIAELMQRKYGIYYMIPIIQSGHESAWGNSKLAREGLNLFGITATKWWVKNGGKVINFNTNEFVNGNNKMMKRGFRQYENWFHSFKDYCRLISSLSCYRKSYEYAKKGKGGVIDFYNSLNGTYATDPSYSKKLIKIYKGVSS